MTLTDITGLWWIKSAAIGLGVLLLVGGGYWAGYSRASSNGAAAVTTSIIKQVKAQPAETKKVVEYKDRVHTVYKTITQKVTEYVQDDSVCDIGADTLSVLNSGRDVLPGSRVDGEGTKAQ